MALRMATEEEDLNIDDHDNEDQVEDQLEKEVEEIIECFKPDFNDFMKEVQVNSSNLPEQASNDEEFKRIKDFQENQNKHCVSESQEKIAKDFFKKKILKSFPETFWTRFKHFDFFIVVPKFLSLGKN